ncbi:hypothetical protein BL253_29910 [Pseudofrankia asymbiotica]|uniref:Uncharacterized protein n=1 Tax=Pseudofrankia asymbiotica TaxID=1834516 RepID=A0A1V2I4V3_9ACTN|nr:hypothetical protein BL253_29910 [Pseudofrankia asymbiotica]
MGEPFRWRRQAAHGGGWREVNSAGGRWPVAGGRWPVAGGRWLVAGGRRPVAGGRRQRQAAEAVGGRSSARGLGPWPDRGSGDEFSTTGIVGGE